MKLFHKTIFAFAAACLLSFALFSCVSKEEKVVNDLQNLYEDVKENSESYTDEDWNNVMERYDAIKNDFELCNFTSEQTKEIGRVQTKLDLIVYKKALGDAVSKSTDAFGQAVNFLEGATQGLQEALQEELTDIDDE